MTLVARVCTHGVIVAGPPAASAACAAAAAVPRWPREFAGHTFDNYIQWLKSCSLLSALDLPAVSVPCGITAAGTVRGVRGRVGALTCQLQVVLTHFWHQGPAHTVSSCVGEALGVADRTQQGLWEGSSADVPARIHCAMLFLSSRT
jgi:hypothetical protein